MAEEDIDYETAVDETEYTVFGLSLYNVFKCFLSLAIFIGAILVRKYVSLGARFVLEHLSLPKKIESALEHLLAIPLSFATVFAGFWISAHVLDLPPELDFVFDHIAESVVNLAVFWIAFFLITPAADLWTATSSTQHTFGDEIKELVTKILKAVVVIIGFLAIMEVWGINVTAFLAGLGLVGLAVSFAARDSISHLFGSFCLILDRVFHKGEFIISGDVAGIVEHFGIRVTQIRKLDTTLVFVPNGNLSNSVITNVSQGKRREISWSPKLRGDTREDTVKEIIEDTLHFLKKDEAVHHPDGGGPLVHVSDISDGTITLMIYFHFEKKDSPSDWADYLAARERVALEFKTIVEKHKSGFAVPARILNVHK